MLIDADADELTRRYAGLSFQGLLDDGRGAPIFILCPTCAACAALRQLADLYDEAQAARHDERRAIRIC